MDLLTIRLSEKDAIIRDLEARLADQEQFLGQTTDENNRLKNEVLMLRDELERSRFEHPPPGFAVKMMYPRDMMGRSFNGTHSNRSKSTSLIDSGEKSFEKNDENFLRMENEKLKRVLEEKEKLINDLRIEIEEKPKLAYQIKNLEKYVDDLENELKERNQAPVEVEPLQRQSFNMKQTREKVTKHGSSVKPRSENSEKQRVVFRQKSAEKVSVVPHNFIEKDIEEFDFLPEAMTDRKVTHKEISENDRSLLDIFLELLAYLREALTDVLFEIFIRSANHAYHRKINSLILFIVNVKELKDRTLKGLLIVLFLYRKMKKIIRLYVPEYGKMTISSKDFRNQANTWVIDNIREVRHRSKKDKTNKNQEYLLLFRLLSVKYRVKYPLKGKTLELEQDVRALLENKICGAFLKVFAKEESQVPNTSRKPSKHSNSKN